MLWVSVGPRRGNTRMNADVMRGIIRNYNGFVDKAEDVTPEVLEDALRPAFELSKIYCPKDTGKLVNSAYLESVKYRGKIRVEIGYAKGGNPPYAVNVHENLEWRHKDPTRAKWLQAALEETSSDIQGNIVAGYKRRLR